MRMPSRRISAWVAATGMATAIAVAAPQRPDILFIAIDDLNDWIGCLGGHPQAQTPHLDRLAGRGVLFANAHCAAPACNPSRAALMSGLRPYATGIYHNGQPYYPVLKDTLTLNRYMRQNGYVVAGGGKIYHGSGGLADPKREGWDEYFNRPGDPKPPRASMTGLNRDHFDGGPLDVADEDMGDYALVTWATEKLNEKIDAPLFHAVGFVKPHLPWYVPKKTSTCFRSTRSVCPPC